MSMQGAELLKDPDFAQTLERSPFQARDLPGLSTAVADSFDKMPDDIKQQLSETLAELEELSDEELLSFLRLVVAVEKDPEQYPKLVDALIQSGAVEPGEMPEQYDPTLMGIVKSIIGQALLRVREKAPRFAKGGIVSLRQSAQKLQNAGRGEDSLLAHITPREASILKGMGGGGTINPTTGLLEFKLSKILKSVFKVGAQIIGTAVLSFMGVPPPIAGAIVGGVSTLLSGGSAKDALKSALFSGLTAGITSGISSSFSGGDFFSGFMGSGSSSAGGSIGERISGLFGGTSTAGAGEAAASVAGEAGVPLAEAPAYNVATQGSEAAAAARQAAGVTPTVTPPAAASSSSGGIGDLMSMEGIKKFAWDYKFPLALAGGAALIAADRKPKTAKPSLVPTETGADLLAKYPEKYGVNPETLVPRTVQFGPSQVFPENRYIGSFGANPAFQTETRYVKAGGHINGPGTGTSDSIPARLSDGEFVMTAKAVRGAGDGDRMKGARKMYELMDKFERMA
jgi:hypothetical protein